MTRIHITASGKAAPCTATIRDCPRGGSDQHYDSLKEAVLAMRRREVEDAAKRDRQQVPPAVEVEARTPEERAEDKRVAEAYASQHANARVSTDRWGNIQVEVRFSDSPIELMSTVVPMTEVRAWNETPYTQDEVDAITFEELRKAELLTEGWTIAHGHKISALGTTFYGTKQVQFSNLWTPVLSKAETLDTITHEVAHAKVGTGHGHDETWQEAHRAMGGSSEEKHHSKDPAQQESYRERFRKFYPNGVKGGTRSGVAKKELDPAIIEALKLKYLKKFKMPFDESGLSIPELLQMAQRGELG